MHGECKEGANFPIAEIRRLILRVLHQPLLIPFHLRISPISARPIRVTTDAQQLKIERNLIPVGNIKLRLPITIQSVVYH